MDNTIIKATTISEDEVKHISKLANLHLTEVEVKKLQKQLGETLQFINQLKEIDTKNVPPTSNVNGLENIFREDTVTSPLSQEEALKNAKSTYKGFFKVKAVMDRR